MAKKKAGEGVRKRKEEDGVEKINENASPEEKKQKEDTVPAAEGSKMRFQGYIVRIVFVVLVAMAFSYRAQIMEAVTSTFSGIQKTSSPPSNPARAVPPKEPLQPKDPDYYNPPFDPDNPSEPLYSKSGTRLVTLNELAAHGHSGPLKPIWLAILGKVFNVDRGAEHYYGPDGGYNFFTGRDGTKAFVTGEFNETGLTDDISGLTPLQVGELEDWASFYEKDYEYVGKLIGRYYTREGSPTKYWYHYQKKLGEKDKMRAEMKALEKKFPGCNSHWSEATKGKVYCSDKSGGVHRDWVGYPRRFFAPGSKQWRCACVHQDDLDNPQIRLYPDCDPASSECKVDPEKIKAMRARGE